MGYNSRALRLRDAVRTIVTDYDGVFPREMSELLQIKGIGPYTAAAIRNFAWNLPTPCIDTNIRRILHRTFYGPEETDGTWKIGDRILLDVAARCS
jgi:A/G-specific adenine glycosylase